MSKYIVGIDPGVNGGICLLRNGKIIAMKVFPKLPDGKLDIYKMNSMLKKISKLDDVFVIVERVHAMFSASAGSTFSFGKAVGILEALVVSNGLRYVHCDPKTWQKVAWQGVKPIYKPMKASKTGSKKKPQKRIDTKKTSDLASRKIFPGTTYTATSKSKKRHDGIIDASLIAWYGHVEGF